MVERFILTMLVRWREPKEGVAETYIGTVLMVIG